MFKRTHLASAVVMALTCQLSYAQDSSTQDDESAVEVIQVSGIRGSLSQSLNIKRQSLQIVDAIVAEDIGKFPDNNVVEALQRVTGIQVTDRGAGEVNTVTIRGLTDVTTTVNGRNIFTASGRAVALADIPASLLKGVNIYKTRGAAQIGSGIAGQIDVETQRPFNFDGSAFVLAGRVIHQEQADETDPQLSMLASNRWELDKGGEFGALVNLSYTRTNFRDQSITAGAQVPFMTFEPAAGFTPLQRIFPDQCTPNCWEPGTDEGLSFAEGATLNINGVDTPYYLARDAVFGSDFRGERERPAVNISLQWAPNDQSEYTFEAFYNGFRNETFNSLFFSFVDWWGAVDENDPVNLIPGTNIIDNRYVNAPFNFNSGDFATGKTDSYLYSLGGKWEISDDFSLKSELYYQDSEFTTTFLAMRTTAVHPRLYVDFNDKDGIPALEFPDSDVTDPGIYTVAEGYDNGSAAKGDAITFTADAEYIMDDSFFNAVRFGVYLDKRTSTEGNRDVNGFLGQPFSSVDAELQYHNENFFDGQANFPSSWVAANGYYLNDNTAQFRSQYGFDADPQLFYNFDIEETTVSAYVEADFETELGGRRLDGRFGLRYETSDGDLTFFTQDPALPAMSTAERDDSTLLPSAVIRYHIQDDLIARFAYTETIRRPAFNQLNSYVQYFPDVTDIGYGTATGGNPNLEPVESTNIDLSLEWYFAPASSLYATYFQRDIEGFVSDSVRAVMYQGPDDDAPYPYILGLPDNSSNGDLSGWEIGAVYFPEDLPEVLDGIGVQASYTILDSDQDIPIYDRTSGELTGYTTQPIFGVSENSYSIVGIYEKDNFDMRLSYVWREDFLHHYEARLFANPLGVYNRPETSVDFQLSYDVTDNLTLTFDATNLTEELYQSYYQYEDTHNFGNALYSRTFALGVRYKM